MPLLLDLEKAGPLPPELTQAVADISTQLERGEIEPAEAAAIALLDRLSAPPHIFLLLSEAARLRGDNEAALDFLRNACLLNGVHLPLLVDGLKRLIDADRLLDAREIILRLQSRSQLPQIRSELGVILQRPEALEKVLALVDMPAGKLAKMAGAELLAAVPNISFDDTERPASVTLPALDDKSAESSIIESTTIEGPLLDMSSLSMKTDSLLPPKTPFIDTPNHFLAQKISCPGCGQYLLPLPPTWNVPRADKLFHMATSAIIRAVDFMESAHYRGVFPTYFLVDNVDVPEHGSRCRPEEFLWELANPGFSRTVIAMCLSGYEATRHIVALKQAVRSAKALAAHQNRLGGWSKTFRIRQDIGRGLPISSPFNAVWIGSDTTCASLGLLVAAAQQLEAPMITTAAMRTVQAIIQCQNPDGSWPMVWVEQEKTRVEFERRFGKACLLDHVMDNAMRSLALARYALHRVDVVPSMVAAIQWLLKYQQTSKVPGWLASYDAGGQAGPHGPYVSLAATMSAIDALCFGAAVSDTSACIEAAMKALHWVESFERSTKSIPDLYDPVTGQPKGNPEKIWTPSMLQQELIYLRRRLFEDCQVQPPLPENLIRGRILHDAEEMCGLVAGIVQTQNKSGTWAGSDGRFVVAGSYVWHLATFILQEQAGLNQIPLDSGRRNHWQDFLLPDRQWLRIGRE